MTFSFPASGTCRDWLSGGSYWKGRWKATGFTTGEGLKRHTRPPDADQHSRPLAQPTNASAGQKGLGQGLAHAERTQRQADLQPNASYITRLLDELNEGEDDGIATFEVIGMNEVFAGLSNEGTVGKINLSATLLDWSRVNHPHNAYFGIIDGSQLKAWWAAHGKRLVAKNIRYALGDTDVNIQIRACASPDTSLSVAAKTGIGRFFNDLSKSPYKSVFNPNTTGARAFNATRVLRAVDEWIVETKGSATKKSGYSWGVLIHGNRAIASSVFNKLGSEMIDRSINDFEPSYKAKVTGACNKVYHKIVQILEEKFPSKALAVLFKGPNNCKTIYDDVASG